MIVALVWRAFRAQSDERLTRSMSGLASRIVPRCCLIESRYSFKMGEVKAEAGGRLFKREFK